MEAMPRSIRHSLIGTVADPFYSRITSYLQLGIYEREGGDEGFAILTWHNTRSRTISGNEWEGVSIPGSNLKLAGHQAAEQVGGD